MTEWASACPHCGNWHTGVCPRVKSVEYNPDGTVRRVEYHDPATPQTGSWFTPCPWWPLPHPWRDGPTCRAVS